MGWMDDASIRGLFSGAEGIVKRTTKSVSEGHFLSRSRNVLKNHEVERHAIQEPVETIFGWATRKNLSKAASGAAGLGVAGAGFWSNHDRNKNVGDSSGAQGMPRGNGSVYNR